MPDRELIEKAGSKAAEALGVDEPTSGGALDFIEMCRSLDALTSGNTGNMRHWMHTENMDLGAVPAEIIRQPDGTKRVLRYLRGMLQKV